MLAAEKQLNELSDELEKYTNLNKDLESRLEESET